MSIDIELFKERLYEFICQMRPYVGKSGVYPVNKSNLSRYKELGIITDDKLFGIKVVEVPDDYYIEKAYA